MSRPLARRGGRRTPPPEVTDEQKQAAAKAEYNRLLTARSGGVYVPPARLRALQASVQDKTSKEYQRMAWEALKKSINGLVNKATAGNMRSIINELFGENLVRGRGLLAQSLIKAQYASLPFTPVYACIAACVNSKLPAVGALLLRRLLLRFRKGFRRNDKAVCRSATTFLAHLVNTQVADEMLAAQMLLLLLHSPTDDSVEIAVGLTREVGHYLETMSPTVLVVVFDRLHHILNEADMDKRTQYAIEVLFQNRRDGFKDQPAVRDDLDLIEEEDQVKHLVELDGKLDDEATLNIFRYDERWEAHELEYARLRREILNEDGDEDGDEDSDSGSDSSSSSSSSADEQETAQKALDVKDRTNADLVALRRTIYLTIQSSMNADEAVHKLLAVSLPEGREGELPSMVVECCSQEKTYTKFFGLLGERLAKLSRRWATLFEDGFARYYATIHRYETAKLRNIACFFGHMLASDALGWYVLAAVRLSEDETTSASRIFVKILVQEIAEAVGMPRLRARLAEPDLQPSLDGLFPSDDNARHLRFSINYFTSIGMGPLTEDMRDRLQNLPKPALPAVGGGGGAAAEATGWPANDDDHHHHGDSASSYSSSSSSSSSSYTGSSYSRSPSRSPVRRGRPSSRSQSRSRSRSPSYDSRSRSRDNARDRSRDDNRARPLPPRYRSRDRSYSVSRSPSPRSVSPPPSTAAQPAAAAAAASTRPARPRNASYSSAGSYSRSPSRASRASPAPSVSPPRRRGRSYSRSPSPGPSRRGGRGGGRGGGGRGGRDRGGRDRGGRRGRPPSDSRSPPISPSAPSAPLPVSGSRRRRRSDSMSSRGSQGPPRKHRRGG